MTAAVLMLVLGLLLLSDCAESWRLRRHAYGPRVTHPSPRAAPLVHLTCCSHPRPLCTSTPYGRPPKGAPVTCVVCRDLAHHPCSHPACPRRPAGTGPTTDTKEQ